MLAHHSPVFIYVYVPSTTYWPFRGQKSSYLNKTRATYEHHVSTGAVLKMPELLDR